MSTAAMVVIMNHTIERWLCRWLQEELKCFFAAKLVSGAGVRLTDGLSFASLSLSETIETVLGSRCVKEERGAAALVLKAAALSCKCFNGSSSAPFFRWPLNRFHRAQRRQELHGGMLT